MTTRTEKAFIHNWSNLQLSNSHNTINKFIIFNSIFEIIYLPKWFCISIRKKRKKSYKSYRKVNFLLISRLFLHSFIFCSLTCEYLPNKKNSFRTPHYTLKDLTTVECIMEGILWFMKHFNGKSIYIYL